MNKKETLIRFLQDRRGNVNLVPDIAIRLQISTREVRELRQEINLDPTCKYKIGYSTKEKKRKGN